MTLKLMTRAFLYGLLLCMLASCTVCPPFNDFIPDQPIARRTVGGVAVGALVGGVAYGTVAGAVAGGAIGGAVGALIGLQHESKTTIIKQLRKMDMQVVSYGSTMTLIVPTDKYFMFNSPRLNEVCYPGLITLIKFLRFYPACAIYVAGFTDNVGSYCHKKMLAQSQAETMATFLWAHDIPAQVLRVEGYGDKFSISDNKLIHGSAQNRRIEIQWFTAPVSNAPCERALIK